jgi:hypothetical protein
LQSAVKHSTSPPSAFDRAVSRFGWELALVFTPWAAMCWWWNADDVGWSLLIGAAFVAGIAGARAAALLEVAHDRERRGD